MKTVLSLLVAFLLVPSTMPTASHKPDAKTLAAFDRFRSLAGEWRGKSTKGWTEVLNINVIADGTCVLETSRFAHGGAGQNGNDGMATMYHLDGETLMLTHYCMAHNQPRLRATEISDDSGSITFTFIDGTNLASRDVGHMDKVRYHFDDNDHFRSQWTFYAKGKEQWMEQITYERTAGPSTQPTTQPADPR